MAIDPQLLKIQPKKVRLIETDGKMYGVIPFDEAIELSETRGLDLILLNDKQNPPIVKLGDYKKFLYEKKLKERKKKTSEVKEIRINFNEAVHDLQRKAKLIDGFLENKNQVRIKMMLRGRESIFVNLAKEKFNKFLSLITIPYNIVQPLKVSGSMLITLISKK